MERHTIRDTEGTRFIMPKGEVRSASGFSVNNVRILLDLLADYEEAEEEGLLVRFPKKVYTLDTTPLAKGVIEWEVMCGEYNVRDRQLTRLDVVHKGFGGSTASILSIYRGNKWYLTREEAEDSLAKEE